MTTDEAPPKATWRPTRLQYEALIYIRDHPRCRTGDMVVPLKRYLGNLTTTLYTLLKRGAVGREVSPLYGEFESRWTLEAHSASALDAGLKPRRDNPFWAAQGADLCRDCTHWRVDHFDEPPHGCLLYIGERGGLKACPCAGFKKARRTRAAA